MVELNDLRLNEPTARPPVPVLESRSGPSLLVPGILLVALIGVLAGTALWPRRAAPPPVTTPAQAQPLTPPASRAAAEPGETIDLPPLADTDALVRQLVGRLSSHPRVAAWLATDGLLRNFAVVLSNISEGGTAVKALAAQRPRELFAVRESGSGAFIDPASYHRYDAYADAVASLDARGTARLYATLKPRLAEAYREVGPNSDVDAALTKAIQLLVRTPAGGESIALTRRSVLWEYADPAMESLPPAQRQLLRMGPRNQRIIQDKLRELAPYLGIDLR